MWGRENLIPDPNPSPNLNTKFNFIPTPIPNQISRDESKVNGYLFRPNNLIFFYHFLFFLGV